MVVGCALPVLLAGCIGGASPLGGLKDPMAGTTFRDAGSNETGWRLEVSGEFSLPSGVRFEVQAENQTCITRGLLDVKENVILRCEHPKDTRHLHDIIVQDRDADGRIDQGDHIEVRAPHGAALPAGNYTLTLSLHKELPIFLLAQRLDAGPVGQLQVELFG